MLYIVNKSLINILNELHILLTTGMNNLKECCNYEENERKWKVDISDGKQSI